MLDLSVIVPVRNAEEFAEECFASIVRAEPREIIVVDGMSTDKTIEIVQRYPVQILYDEGKGVPAARMMGIRAATSDTVVLIDVDIVLPDGALAELYKEFKEGGYDGLQAGLHSTGGPGYWGQALVYHHNHGRSKNWPGVMATIFKRDVLLQYGFDERFRSGEDIELRWRLRRTGLKMAVSRRTTVTHRYGDGFEFAKGQWLADGKGLGRMISKYRWRAAVLFMLPLAGSMRGIFLSLIRLKPQWIPYFLCYLVYNYWAMPGGLRERF